MSDAGDQALGLWRFWFEKFGNPWIEGDRGELFCIFCDGADRAHDADCIYLMAADLLTRESSTPMPVFGEGR